MDDDQPGTRILVVFLCIVAVIGTPLRALAEAFDGICLMGCGVPAGMQQEEPHGISPAFLLGTLVPMIGIVLSVHTKQVTAFLLFLIVLVLTLILGAAALSEDRRPQIPAPPEHRVSRCQEHSGGDTTCPGG
jgi:hypothetical protein